MAPIECGSTAPAWQKMHARIVCFCTRLGGALNSQLKKRAWLAVGL